MATSFGHHAPSFDLLNMGYQKISIFTKIHLHDSPRDGEDVVGRIDTASPRQGERYYLRTFLPHFTGSASSKDIRSKFVGEVCSTCQEFCLRCGLLSDDAEWQRALRDALLSSFQPLTELHDMILAHCEPSRANSSFKSSNIPILLTFRTDSDHSRHCQIGILPFCTYLQNLGMLAQRYCP